VTKLPRNIITSYHFLSLLPPVLRQGGYGYVMPGVCLSVCLSFCLSVSNFTKNCWSDFMKILTKTAAIKQKVVNTGSHPSLEPKKERAFSVHNLAHISGKKLIGSSWKFYRRCVFGRGSPHTYSKFYKSSGIRIPTPSPDRLSLDGSADIYALPVLLLSLLSLKNSFPVILNCR